MNYQAELERIERLLDSETISDIEFEVLNKRANYLLAEIEAFKNQIIKQKQLELQVRFERFQELAKTGRMAQMVEEFGSEFQDMYYISDTFIVYSAYDNKWRTANHWQCTSQKEALDKKFQLIYWRVYDVYFRNKVIG